MDDTRNCATGVSSAQQDSQGQQSGRQASSSSSSQRGGTHEQHVKAGRAGGLAPHECRSRECSKKREE